MKEKSELEVQSQNILNSADSHVIAWVRKKTYVKPDRVIHEFRNLAESVGFRIKRIEIERPLFYGGRSEIVKLHTDTFSKVPEDRAGKAKEWLGKILARRHVTSADVRIAGLSINKNIRPLEKVENQ